MAAILDKVKAPFSTDANLLTTVGVVGALHSAAQLIVPKKVNEKLVERALDSDYPKDPASIHATTRIQGVMAGAAALTAIALAKKDDSGVVRRAALAAQGVGMLGVAGIQGFETHKGRNQKNVGWASTAIHGALGAVCAYKGLKDGVGK